MILLLFWLILHSMLVFYRQFHYIFVTMSSFRLCSYILIAPNLLFPFPIYVSSIYVFFFNVNSFKCNPFEMCELMPLKRFLKSFFLSSTSFKFFTLFSWYFSSEVKRNIIIIIIKPKILFHFCKIIVIIIMNIIVQCWNGPFEELLQLGL